MLSVSKGFYDENGTGDVLFILLLTFCKTWGDHFSSHLQNTFYPPNNSVWNVLLTFDQITMDINSTLKSKAWIYWIGIFLKWLQHQLIPCVVEDNEVDGGKVEPVSVRFVSACFI